MTLSGRIGWLAAAAIDVAFLVTLAAVVAREIVTGRNWRNLKVVGIVSALAAGNLAFHLEAHFTGTAEYSTRVGIGAIVLLIMLIGGRIVPSFTRNWLSRRGPGRLPAPLDRFDMAAIRQAIEEGSNRGASTISQQVVKNVFLWHGRSWVRKAMEAVLTRARELAS